jgi:hypothetical protein
MPNPATVRPTGTSRIGLVRTGEAPVVIEVKRPAKDPILAMALVTIEDTALRISVIGFTSFYFIQAITPLMTTTKQTRPNR